MYSYIDETDDGRLQESFVGNYYFTYIPEEVNRMKYPVPPDYTGIDVAMGKFPEEWVFSPEAIPYIHELQLEMELLRWFRIRELYPTVVPEWPGIPMIAWDGPFPQKALLSVKYQYTLLRQEGGYLYFYALGTGKYYETYQKEAIAFLDISMPMTYGMSRLFLDNTPHAFAVTREKDDSGNPRRIVSIYATAEFGHFTKDVIGRIVPMIWPNTNTGLEEKMELTADLPPQIRLRYKVEECGTTEPPGNGHDVFSVGKRMIVTDDIYFNCCAEYVRMTILVDGDSVTFREKAMEEAPCDCICYYPMKGVAGPFMPGIYQVELIDPHGKTVINKEIEIE
jgi:hypothetical protein